MENDSKKDLKFVMIAFALIALLLIFSMINNFKIIDCCYFGIVLFFAIRYLIVSRDQCYTIMYNFFLEVFL